MGFFGRLFGRGKKADTSISVEPTASLPPGTNVTKTGAELKRVLAQAKQILQTQDNAVFPSQVNQLKYVKEIGIDLNKQMSELNRMILHAEEITKQTAEWAVEMNNAKKHFAEHTDLSAQFVDQFMKYSYEAGRLTQYEMTEEAYNPEKHTRQQRKEMESIERKRPVRIKRQEQIVDALTSINDMMQAMQQDITDFNKKATNVLDNQQQAIDMVKGNKKLPGIVTRANKMSATLKEFEVPTGELVTTMQSTKRIYNRMLNESKKVEPIIKNVAASTKNATDAARKILAALKK